MFEFDLEVYDPNDEEPLGITKVKQLPSDLVKRHRPNGGNRGIFNLINRAEVNEAWIMGYDHMKINLGPLGHEWYESVRNNEGQGRFPSMNELLRGIVIEEWVRCEQEPKFNTPQKLMNAKQNRKC